MPYLNSYHNIHKIFLYQCYCITLCTRLYLAAGVWEDRGPAGVWRPVLRSLSPTVYWPVSGSQEEILLSRMHHWWVHDEMFSSNPTRCGKTLETPLNFFCCFQVSTHALFVRSPVTGWSDALSLSVGSSTTRSVFWPTRPPSHTTKASAAPCMSVCPATSLTPSTSAALKVSSMLPWGFKPHNMISLTWELLRKRYFIQFGPRPTIHGATYTQFVACIFTAAMSPNPHGTIQMIMQSWFMIFTRWHSKTAQLHAAK